MLTEDPLILPEYNVENAARLGFEWVCFVSSLRTSHAAVCGVVIVRESVTADNRRHTPPVRFMSVVIVAETQASSKIDRLS